MLYLVSDQTFFPLMIIRTLLYPDIETSEYDLMLKVQRFGERICYNGMITKAAVIRKE